MCVRVPVKEQYGVQSKHNVDADVVFYKTCPNCLVRIYQATYHGQEARVLLFYSESHTDTFHYTVCLSVAFVYFLTHASVWVWVLHTVLILNNVSVLYVRLIIGREGKHQEVVKLRGYEESIKRQAKCLQFLPDPHYMYDGEPGRYHYYHRLSLLLLSPPLCSDSDYENYTFLETSEFNKSKNRWFHLQSWVF